MVIVENLKNIVRDCGVEGEINFTIPPNPELGDLSFACFDIAKLSKKNPIELAQQLTTKILLTKYQILDTVKTIGPYVNFFLNPVEVAKMTLATIAKQGKKYGVNNSGTKKKVMVEFAHPNTHKPVHIGHLRNMVTGESVVRLLENSGYKVIRANYQGDVGLHIAKCLWGIFQNPLWKAEHKTLKTVSARAQYLGKVYALGGQAYENDEAAKKAIADINAKIYSGDKEVKTIYNTTRQWSLEYFDAIYKRVGVKKFDRLYFESETFKPGKEIVLKYLAQGVFKSSQGAVIFEGSKYGLHDRVFLNSQGLPTYEAKDLALAEMQFKEYNPSEILHLVAKEQTEYFKVMFKALEFTLPASAGREKHLVYGWVSLKDGKMSSRTGNVVLAEWLLDEVEQKITEVMKDREMKNKVATIKKIAVAAVKYSMLKTGVGNDIVFDINESISLTGSSGPYLLYIGARIQSILRKAGRVSSKIIIPAEIAVQEKSLLLKLGEFEEVAGVAAAEYDPSKIAHYLFDLAKKFNEFYDNCPVIQAEGQQKSFRINLISAVWQIMERGLYLLGIETVDEM